MCQKFTWHILAFVFLKSALKRYEPLVGHSDLPSVLGICKKHRWKRRERVCVCVLIAWQLCNVVQLHLPRNTWLADKFVKINDPVCWGFMCCIGENCKGSGPGSWPFSFTSSAKSSKQIRRSCWDSVSRNSCWPRISLRGSIDWTSCWWHWTVIPCSLVEWLDQAHIVPWNQEFQDL